MTIDAEIEGKKFEGRVGEEEGKFDVEVGVS